MAIVKIYLEENEHVHDVKECLCKALSTDNILKSKEKYNDELMEDLMSEMEKEYSSMYLDMTKEIVETLKRDVR